mmetsp:Transcript_13960/g.28586  ORF Transcript_13960/g.28586 Transcript_13960/m.28586 type:complete len:166 (-) Transcript_13960:532-1029(-)
MSHTSAKGTQAWQLYAGCARILSRFLASADSQISRGRMTLALVTIIGRTESTSVVESAVPGLFQLLQTDASLARYCKPSAAERLCNVMLDQLEALPRVTQGCNDFSMDRVLLTASLLRMLSPDALSSVKPKLVDIYDRYRQSGLLDAELDTELAHLSSWETSEDL